MFRSSSLWPGLLLGALSGLVGQGAGSRPQQQSDFGTSPEFFLLLLLLLVFLILLAWWALRRPPRGAGETPAARPAPHAEPEHRPAQPHVSKAAPAAEEPVASAPAPEAAEIQTVLPAAEPVAAAPVVESAPVVEAAPEPVAVEVPAVEAPAVETPAVEPPASAEPDDLRKIEGIGPKVEKALHSLGITTFAQLAVADPADLEARVKAQGVRILPGAPGTWPEQAALAARGDWAGFEKLTASLKGGRKS